MKTNIEIWALMKDELYDYAEEAIRERFTATHLTPAQINAMMYYAYEHGHYAGRYEVCLIAMGLLTEIAEAK